MSWYSLRIVNLFVHPNIPGDDGFPASTCSQCQHHVGLLVADATLLQREDDSGYNQGPEVFGALVLPDVERRPRDPTACMLPDNQLRK